MGGRIVREVVSDPLPPRIGKLHIGKKVLSSTGKEIPSSCDYFIPSGKYASLFTQVYGEKPNSLLVYFPSDDASLVCNECYVYRNEKGKKIAKGDGENFIVWSDKVQKYVPMNIEKYPDLMEKVAQKYPSPTGWQATLTLNVVLPMVNKIYGVWTLETKGVASSIPQIRDTFDSLLAKNGHINGVLCDLNVEFAKSDSPKASKFPILSIVPNETQANMDKLKGIALLGE